MCIKPEKKHYPDNSVITLLNLGGYEVLVYQPNSSLMTNSINYGFSGPTMLVFGDGAFSCDDAKTYADKLGLSEIAASQGCAVAFVNPQNADWRQEKADAYQTVIGNARIEQRTHKDGVLALTDKDGSVLSYHLLGSAVRGYVYAVGKGADYIAANCLRKLEQEGPLGLSEITMAGCTLENLSILPVIEKNDIPMVSVGNSEEVNDLLRENCGSVVVAETADYPAQFRQQIGKHKRWKGKLCRADNPAWDGIRMEPGTVMVETSSDNVGYYQESENHPVHYVAFYSEELDVVEHKAPLMLCFHGGGDSALCTALLAGWPTVAKEQGFLLVSVELHLDTTATEIRTLIAHLQQKYAIDSERIYATGFSMGGIKSWDLYQECPEIFAGLAPMNATVDVGRNQYNQLIADWNRTEMVPVFYEGGEISPLPELPFHEQKCINRVQYVLQVNDAKRTYNVSMDEKKHWENPFFGVDGDIVYRVAEDEDDPESILTVHLYESRDGKYYTAFASVSRQAHDVKLRNSRAAWDFLSQFRRTKTGGIEVQPVSYALKSDDGKVVDNQYNVGR